MRALLVCNLSATRTTRAVTESIARTLSAELKLDVAATRQRDHASLLAADAVAEGYEVVFALGGDGTVNEVVQGLAGSDVRLAVLPGGSTNVWARTLGLPNSASAAAGVLLDRLRSCQQRPVRLGTANGRYFAFTAGFGYDAETVRYVERGVRLKRVSRQAAFLYAGLLAHHHGALGRRPWDEVDVSVSVPGGDIVRGLRTAVCCNSNPWTYLGRRSAQLCPRASMDAGLDVTALSRLRLPFLLRVARTALWSDRIAEVPGVATWHDHDAYDLESNTPLALQVDGDYVGAASALRLRSVRRALTIVA